MFGKKLPADGVGPLKSPEELSVRFGGSVLPGSKVHVIAPAPVPASWKL